MRVQLSKKSKAEFIELINKDSITCWFEGDEFVVPSGQGKTAKGIVLGKLLVWQHQQSKIDELQRRNQMLNDNIKEQGQKLVYQNEVIETQAEKLLGLRDEKAGLQKRIDDYEKLTTSIRNEFDLWSDDSEFADVIEAQIENLEALRGERD